MALDCVKKIVFNYIEQIFSYNDQLEKQFCF